MTAVLLTGSRAPATLDLARRFADEGWFVVVADSQPALASSSRAVGAAYRVPSARFRPFAFADAVAGIVRRHAVDLVVPTCEEIFWLAGAVAQGGMPAAADAGAPDGAPGAVGHPGYADLAARVFAPPLETLRTLHDKARFGALLDELGIARPRTEVVASRITWRRRERARRADPSEALVVKPAYSRFGSRTHFVAAGEPLPGLEGHRVTRDEPWLVQERLAGDELCTYAVAVRGRLTAFVAYRPVWRAGTGAGVCFERIDSGSTVFAEARRIAETIAHATALTGQFGLDLIDEGDDVGSVAGPGRLNVLECNPRATSGIHLFAKGDGLASAFAGLGMAHPSRSSARLALPHAMYAVSGMRDGASPGAWLRQRAASDALRVPGDRIPFGRLVRAVLVQAATAARTRSSLLAASTHDIEWNGEHIAPRTDGGALDHDAAHLHDRPRAVRSAAHASVRRSAHDGGPAGAEAFPSGADAPWLERVAAAFTTVPDARVLAPNVAAGLIATHIGADTVPATVSSASVAPDASIGRRARLAGRDQSYVVSPFTHYVSYVRDEVGELASPVARALARPLLDGLGALLRLGRVDDIVFVGNALVSTNLHADYSEAEIEAMTASLVREHPRRAIAFRSVHGRARRLPDVLVRCGYRLVPARSVLFVATADAEWSSLRDVRRDRALLEASGYTVGAPVVDPATGMSDAVTRERIAQLYGQLYVGKYSQHNPRYTAEFVGLAQRFRLLDFAVLQKQGRIDAVVGSYVANGLLAAPFVGYDTDLPQELGLYRMLSFLMAHRAHGAGVDLHGSSGVADFKRNRGAEPEIEYTAVYARHLPWRRRAAWLLLEAVVRGVAVPLVQRQGL
jgi:hypothetical protein